GLFRALLLQPLLRGPFLLPPGAFALVLLLAGGGRAQALGGLALALFGFPPFFLGPFAFLLFALRLLLARAFFARAALRLGFLAGGTFGLGLEPGRFGPRSLFRRDAFAFQPFFFEAL